MGSIRLGEWTLGEGTLGSTTPPTMPDYSQDQFSWEGHCWELVQDPALDVALVRPGGSSTAQAEFAARLANILRLNVQNLYVTDEAVINSAVISRLFADMFTANKIGTDQLAANSVTAGKIAASSITGDKIQGNTISGDKLKANTITADLIKANAITGEKIAANTITGDKLMVNSIAADKIASGSLSGQIITGGTLVGSTFATDMKPATNGGIHIDTSNGIRGWDQSGNKTFQLSPTDGSVSIAATLKAMNSKNQGVQLWPTTTAGVGGLWFTDDGTGGAQQAAIYRKAYTNGDEPLVIRGARNGGVQISDILTCDGTISAGLDLMAQRDIIGQEGLRFRHPGSLSGSANLIMDDLGNVRLVKSSRRYKKNIVDWNPDANAVLRLRPRQWQHDDPDNVGRGIISETWNVGFIAEEVDDLGLSGLVTYAGDGKGGWRPEGLNYDRFAAAHQVVLQDHDSRVAELEARITELEGRLTDG